MIRVRMAYILVGIESRAVSFLVRIKLSGRLMPNRNRCWTLGSCFAWITTS